MISESVFLYHLPHRVILSVIFSSIWLPVLLAEGGLNLDTLLFFAFNTAIVLGTIWGASVINISQKGIVLYRVNKLAWSDAMSAKRLNMLGLPYVRVQRRKGSPFWIPLYFIGSKPIQDAILDCAPEGNVLSRVELYKKTK